MKDGREIRESNGGRNKMKQDIVESEKVMFRIFCKRAYRWRKRVVNYKVTLREKKFGHRKYERKKAKEELFIAWA